AEPRRGVVGVGDAEEAGAAGPPGPAGLGVDDAARVAGVVLEGVERDPADRVVDVELVLDAVRDLLGGGDQEQVVRPLLGSRGAGAGAEPREVLLLGLAG